LLILNIMKMLLMLVMNLISLLGVKIRKELAAVVLRRKSKD